MNKDDWSFNRTQAVALRLPAYEGENWVPFGRENQGFETWFLNHPCGARVSIETYRKPDRAPTRLFILPSFSTPGSATNDLFELAKEVRPVLTEQLAKGITIAANRSSAAIARDLQRRLLTSYAPLYKRCLSIKQGQLEAFADAQLIAMELAALANGTVHPEHRCEFAARKLFGSGASLAGVVYPSDAVSLKFNHLRRDQAKVLLDAFQEYEQMPLAQLLEHPRWMELDSPIKKRVEQMPTRPTTAV